MADPIRSTSQLAIPDDDPKRALAVGDPNDPTLQNVSIAGNVYTILISSKDTGGQYCLIDMLVPPGGGPPPHRHDFEEMFTVLDGEIELTFRGDVIRAVAGTTVNIPSNAPHSFKNVSDAPARLLCMCTPGGQDEFFVAVGDRVAGRDSPPPLLSEVDQKERARRAKALAPNYRTEMLV